MYVYRKLRDGDNWLYTVGFFDPEGQWHPESDHLDPEIAATRVAWLNGSRSTSQEAQP
ncbi:hypothetical protein H0Z60_10090 [Ectothiorhodospiraceae bacterium WFHF3C12]|nr:hypothetical protein [Ectothiorhodospiraceae bacterium WFHF3C12]